MKSLDLIIVLFSLVVGLTGCKSNLYESNVNVEKSRANNNLGGNHLYINMGGAVLTANNKLLTRTSPEIRSEIVEKFNYDIQNGSNLPEGTSQATRKDFVFLPSIKLLVKDGKGQLSENKNYALFYQVSADGHHYYCARKNEDLSHYTKDTNKQFYDTTKAYLGEAAADRVVENLKQQTGFRRWKITCVDTSPILKNIVFARSHSDNGECFILNDGTTRIAYFRQGKLKIARSESGETPTQEYEIY